MKEIIDIAYAIHDNSGKYVQYLGVSILSVLENTESYIRVHIMCNESLSQDGREIIVRACEKYRCDVLFYDMKISSDILQEVPRINIYSPASIYRLQMFEVISSDIKKIIYLDIDTIINLDIRLLYELELKDCTLGALKITRANAKKMLVGLPNDVDKYINSGVLIFNTSKLISKYNFWKQSLNYLKQYPHTKFPDQDAISYIFQDDCCYIDVKFNNRINYDSLEECIYHFVGFGKKPWLCYKYKASLLYWKYLLLSPWGNDVEKVLCDFANTVCLDENVKKLPIINKRLFIVNTMIRIGKLIKERICRHQKN